MIAAWYFLHQDEEYPATKFDAFDQNDEACEGDWRGWDGPLKKSKWCAAIEQTIILIGSDAGPGNSGPNEFLYGTGSDGILASRWGSGTGIFSYLISPLEGIQERARQGGGSVFWDFDDWNTNLAGTMAFGQAVALVFSSSDSGEGLFTVDGNEGDRNNLTAWNNTDNLIFAVVTQNNNTIVVVNNVGPLIVELWIEHPNITAVVWVSIQGQEAGNAIADVLYGTSNPSGRLLYTIVMDPADYSAQLVTNGSDSEIVTIDYTEGWFIDYRHHDQGDSIIMWKNGEASPIAEGCSVALWLHEPAFQVSFKVTNTGYVSGTEDRQHQVGHQYLSGNDTYDLKTFANLWYHLGLAPATFASSALALALSSALALFLALASSLALALSIALSIALALALSISTHMRKDTGIIDVRDAKALHSHDPKLVLAEQCHTGAEQPNPTQMSRGKRFGDPLPWLLSKLSYQACSAHIARRNRSKPLLIVDRFRAVSQADGINHQHLQRAMQITSVICAVRQGSRLSSNHLTQLASRLASLPLDVPLHSETLNFASSLLSAGDMAMSTGLGRAFVARALGVPSFGLMLCGVLAELGWGGWKLVGLPALLKATPSLLQAEPTLMLRLLASLQHSGKLGEVDIVWKRSVDSWIQTHLSSWEISDESVDDLCLHFNTVFGFSTTFLGLVIRLSGPLEALSVGGTLARPQDHWPSHLWLIHASSSGHRMANACSVKRISLSARNVGQRNFSPHILPLLLKQHPIRQHIPLRHPLKSLHNPNLFLTDSIASAACDAATHQTTTQQLESVSRENYPVYMLILSDELRNENSQIHTRNAASLALNNALSARVRCNKATTLQDGWPSMSMLDRRSRRASPSDAFKQAALALRPLLSRNAKTTGSIKENRISWGRVFAAKLNLYHVKLFERDSHSVIPATQICKSNDGRNATRHSCQCFPLPAHMVDPATITGSETSNFASSTGDIAMSTGPGRAFVARALRVPSFGLMLCGVLAELGWGGWKLVRLSALLKTTPGLLQAEPTLTLRLLRFRNIPGSWVNLEISDESVDDLYDLTSPSTFADSLAPLLVPIIERALNTWTPEANWRASHANAAWVIGTCMQALSRCKSASWETQVDLPTWTTEIVEHWSWSAKSIDRFRRTSRSMCISFAMYWHLNIPLMNFSVRKPIEALQSQAISVMNGNEYSNN
ncbi:hypothetical protein P692DRAFT_201805432 [Suillus brevipes Sb2]|nr:hypothetical protein P692DRAFT_201805432 [Suillus brevipes Sb2]